MIWYTLLGILSTLEKEEWRSMLLGLYSWFLGWLWLLEGVLMYIVCILSLLNDVFIEQCLIPGVPDDALDTYIS